MSDTSTYAYRQAELQYNSIVELLAAAQDAEDTAEELYNTPLSVATRSAWRAAGPPLLPTEYELLLCTGGPAVRVTGDLDDNFEPITATMKYQDWGTPWTDFHTADESKLLAFASYFYYAPAT